MYVCIEYLQMEFTVAISDLNLFICLLHLIGILGKEGAR